SLSNFASICCSFVNVGRRISRIGSAMENTLLNFLSLNEHNRDDSIYVLLRPLFVGSAFYFDDLFYEVEVLHFSLIIPFFFSFFFNLLVLFCSSIYFS